MSFLLLEEHFKVIVLGFLVWSYANAAKASEELSDGKMTRVLQRQVVNLSEELVAAKIEIDCLKGRIESRADNAGELSRVLLGDESSLRGKKYLILDVNKELGMVILNGGHRDGVKPGLMFNVISGDKSVTTVRVVDVRSAIAGAIIQNMSGELPKVQDRAVLSAGSKN